MSQVSSKPEVVVEELSRKNTTSKGLDYNAESKSIQELVKEFKKELLSTQKNVDKVEWFMVGVVLVMFVVVITITIDVCNSKIQSTQTLIGEMLELEGRIRVIEQNSQPQRDKTINVDLRLAN